MKKAKLTLLYLFMFIAILTIVTVVINLPTFDEELLPEVAEIKNRPAQLFDHSNAYPALIAINAALGKNYENTSKQVREFLNQKISNTGSDILSIEEYKQLMAGYLDYSWKKIYPNCESRKSRNCIQKLHAILQTQAVENASLQELLSRYQRLIGFSEFSDITQVDLKMSYTAFSLLLQIKRLFIADAYVNNPIKTYSDKVIKDMFFWRLLLKNSNYLILKMLSVATLTENINSLSVAIQHRKFDAQQLHYLQKTISSLSDAETNMGRAFEYEFKYAMQFYDAIKLPDNASLEDRLFELFFQPQATKNTSYIYTTQRLKQISALNSAEFYQHIQQKESPAKRQSPLKWSPSTLYNPVGKLLVGYSIPSYNDYMARIHDLNGMFYLLKLQIEIALNPDEGVELLIKQSPYNNPYTQKPMHYNPTSHSIYFNCLDKTSVCELDL